MIRVVQCWICGRASHIVVGTDGMDAFAHDGGASSNPGIMLRIVPDDIDNACSRYGAQSTQFPQSYDLWCYECRRSIVRGSEALILVRAAADGPRVAIVKETVARIRAMWTQERASLIEGAKHTGWIEVPVAMLPPSLRESVERAMKGA